MLKPTVSLISVLLCTALSITSKAGAADQALNHNLKPHLGKQVTVDNDTIVSPDGRALPSGMGTAAEGKFLYEARCLACHGQDGKLPGNEIAGGIGSLTSNRPLKTVGSYWPHATTLFDYIARAMPYNEQKSLSANEVYAITAYVLQLNGIVEASAVLNKNTLPKIKMPNRKGFNELIH